MAGKQVDNETSAATAPVASEPRDPQNEAIAKLALFKDLASHWGIAIVSYSVIVRPTLSMIFHPIRFPSNIEGGVAGFRRALAYVVITAAIASFAFDIGGPPNLSAVEGMRSDAAAPPAAGADGALEMLMEVAATILRDLILAANAVIVFLCGKMVGSNVKTPVTTICGAMYLLGLYNLVSVAWELPFAHLVYAAKDGAASILMPFIWLFVQICVGILFTISAVFWAARILKLNFVQSVGATAVYALGAYFLSTTMALFTPSPIEAEYGAEITPGPGGFARWGK